MKVVPVPVPVPVLHASTIRDGNRQSDKLKNTKKTNRNKGMKHQLEEADTETEYLRERTVPHCEKILGQLQLRMGDIDSDVANAIKRRTNYIRIVKSAEQHPDEDEAKILLDFHFVLDAHASTREELIALKLKKRDCDIMLFDAHEDLKEARAKEARKKKSKACLDKELMETLFASQISC